MKTSKRKRVAAKPSRSLGGVLPHGVSQADFGPVDQLDSQINFAEGIRLAVCGLGQLHDFDATPVTELCDLHEERLRAISDLLLNEKKATAKAVQS